MSERTDVDPGDRMRVLCEASRRAGITYFGASGLGSMGVLRSAATHTGAALLKELRAMGWELVPVDAGERINA